MSIQISGCTVIDNSRNIINANNMCVGVVTITGSTGNIETIGSVTAANFIADTAPTPLFFSPADGEIDVEINSTIVITFDQNISKGTGNVTLRSGSSVGTIIETIGIASTSIFISNGSLANIVPTNQFSPGENIYVVVDAGAFENSNGTGNEVIDTYDFTSRDLELGDAGEGGYLICQSGGIRWIVSPYSTQRSTSWGNRGAAASAAQSNDPCGDWFIPNISLLSNPGYQCRIYWDNYDSTTYWSDTSTGLYFAYGKNFSNGATVNTSKTDSRRSRAFRCVTY